ncbi:MAG: SpoIIE family protein phosphatase [Planctomycetota bacterium]
MPASVVVSMPGRPPFEVALDADLITVGRAEDNVISLRDMNVSRYHFSIERRDPLGFVIRDRDSRNGTVVNGVSIMDKVLVEGDQVRVGGSVLTYRARAGAQALSLAELRPPAASEPARPVPRAVPAAVAAPAGMESGHSGTIKVKKQRRGGDQRWQKLAEVACAINLEHEIEPLLGRILDAVLSLVPSKSGFLILNEDDQLKLQVARSEQAAGFDDAAGSSRLSQQIVREAIAQRRPVLSQDAAGDEHLGQFMSVVNMRLKSILCVPFSAQEEVLGVVYLDEPEVDPFADNGEVVELVGAFGDLAGIALANARLMQEIAGRERLEEELRIASQIQRRFLPQHLPPVRGLELAGRTQPARTVGGDLYDFFKRKEPRQELIVSIGDVAGKGVGAGLVMGTVHSLLHALADTHLRTSEILGRMNRHLSRDLEPGLFVSMLLLRYDEGTGELLFTGAGHEHLVFYRPSTGQLEFMRAGGVVLGLAPDIEARLQERALVLQPGDVIVLYTDGATEAPSPSGEEFGLERLGAAVRGPDTSPAAVVDRVMHAVTAFSPGPQHDDLTVVALRRT